MDIAIVVLACVLTSEVNPPNWRLYRVQKKKKIVTQVHMDVSMIPHSRKITLVNILHPSQIIGHFSFSRFKFFQRIYIYI